MIVEYKTPAVVSHTIKSYPDLKIRVRGKRRGGYLYNGLPRYISYPRPIYEILVNFYGIPYNQFTSDFQHCARAAFLSDVKITINTTNDLQARSIFQQIGVADNINSVTFTCKTPILTSPSPKFSSWQNPISMQKFKFIGRMDI